MSPRDTAQYAIVSDPIMDEAEFYAFPLAPAQAAMLPRDLDLTTDAKHNGSFRVAIEGEVDPYLIEQTFGEIVQRHEILRTIFLSGDGGVEQVVMPRTTFTLETIDLRALDPAEKGNRVETICQEEAKTGFLLTREPAIRVKLLRIEDRRSVLTLTVHQILCDGWSIGLILEELSAIYTSLARGNASLLPANIYQYGDYVVWQREASSLPYVRDQLRYWVDALDGCPQLRLAPDFPVGEVSANSDIVTDLLPREFTDELHHLARANDTTFFSLTMAACMVLMSKRTGETDLAVRTPFAGRNRTEFEGLIGQFVNQTIIRSQLSTTSPFSSFLASVRESIWNALANQAVPFNEVMEALSSSSAVDTEQLFGVNFICQREYGRNVTLNPTLGDARIVTLPSKSQGALYDLNFFLVEREAGWRLSLEYKTDLYAKETALGLITDFRRILEAILVDAKQPVSDLLREEAVASGMPGSSIVPDTKEIPDAIGEDLTSDDPQAIPASFAQERFWTLFQLDPKNAMFNVPVATKVTGALSIPRLKKSLELLADRHESLRTSFSEVDGTLVQVVHRECKTAISEVTLEAGKGDRDASLAPLLSSEIAKPFNVGSLPLFRCLLCSLGGDEHIFLITIHHILSDAWSIGVLQRDLWQAYEGLGKDNSFSFAPLTIQYPDYSIWQREQADGPVMAAHLEYWLKQLSGNLPVLDLPRDRPMSQPQMSRAGLETLLLPDELASNLKSFAQSSDTTLFVVTFACFAMLLSRAAKASDIVIGTPVVNRRLETEPLIGPFAGPVALRLTLPNDPQLSEVVEDARNTTLAALEHADLPFEMLLDNLRFQYSSDRNPLFQFYFFCQPAFLKPQILSELTIAPLPSMSLATPFEMQLAVVEREEGIRVELEYNAALYDKASIEGWLSYYTTILRSLIEKPSSRVSELPAPPRTSSNSIQGSRDILQESARSREMILPGAASAMDGFAEQQIMPRDAIEVALSQIWQRLLNVDQISVTRTFFSLGGHSLMLIKLLKNVNRVFDLNLEITVLFQAPTIEKLARVIREASQHKEWSSLVPLNPHGNHKPLFLVHSYMMYGRLPSALGADFPFYGLRQPPLGKYSTPDWVDHMLQDHIKHIRIVQPNGPYQIAGWCFAGLMAYEIARRLEEAGNEVSLLALFDSWCPYPPPGSRALNKPSGSSTSALQQELEENSPLHSPIYALTYHLNKLTEVQRGRRWRYTHMVLREAFWKVVNRRIREMKGVAYRFFCRHRIPQPPMLRDITVVTYEWIRNYTRKPFSGAITLIRPDDVPIPAEADPTCGWGAMTSGEVRSVYVPGDRRTMFLQPHLSTLATKLREFLS